MKNYYELLGVGKNSTQDEIKKAYRKASSAFHPDKYAGNKKFAEDMMKEINTAYEVLSNQSKKNAYDEWLKSQSTTSKNAYENSTEPNHSKVFTNGKIRKRFLIGFICIALLFIFVNLIQKKKNNEYPEKSVVAPNLTDATDISNQKITWNSKDRNYETLTSVRFTNNTSLIYKSKPNDYSSSPKILLSNQNGVTKEFLTDDHVYIEAAYPSADKAEIAIISNVCGGSSCYLKDTYLVTQVDGSLEKFLIGSRQIKFEATLSNKELISATSNVLLGIDNYGSEYFGEVVFVKDKGFVLPSMKNYYKELLGKYPWDYFDNKVAREPLVSKIGVEKFKQLRNYLEVASGVKIIDYRFLAVNGCLPHACGDSFAVIIIDTKNDDLWWIKIAGDVIESGGTKVTPDKRIYYQELLQKIINKINFDKSTVITISNQGEINVRRN